MLYDDVKKMYQFVGQYPTAADQPALLEKAKSLMLKIKDQAQLGKGGTNDDQHYFNVAVGHYKQLCSIANIEVERNLTEIRLWQRAQSPKEKPTNSHNHETPRHKG